MDGFVPDERQRGVIDAALSASQRAVTPGQFVSEELGRRMQLEADLSYQKQSEQRGMPAIPVGQAIDEPVAAEGHPPGGVAASQVEARAAVKQKVQGLLAAGQSSHAGDRAESTPPPPYGFTSWLDYAVATLDVRSVAVHAEWSDDGTAGWSHQDMRQAALNELEELRRLAARRSR